MTGVKRSPKHDPTQRLLHRWHRRIGVTAALLVLLLASTGIALSHATALRLHERMLDAPWLLALYRIAPQSPPRAMPSVAGWLIWIDHHLYLDGKPLADNVAQPLGAAANHDTIAIANREQLLLLTVRGALLERIDRSALPGPIEAIGNDAQGRIAMRSDRQVFSSDDLLQWQPATASTIRWASADTVPPPADLSAALRAFRGKGVSASRVIADLHSGRFLGTIGPWLMDASAIALIVLAGSGLWMWWQQRSRLRYRHRFSRHR